MQEKTPRSLFFRTRLASLLAERGISQRQLAAETKLSPQSVSNYLRGARELPRAEELYALAQYFGVSMESFLDLGGSKENERVGAGGNTPTLGNPKTRRAVAKIDHIVGELQLQVQKLKSLTGCGEPSDTARRETSE